METSFVSVAKLTCVSLVDGNGVAPSLTAGVKRRSAADAVRSCAPDGISLVCGDMIMVSDS